MLAATFILTLAALQQASAGPPGVRAAAPAPAPVREVRPAPIAPTVPPVVRASSGPVRRVDPNAEAGPLRDDLEAVDPGIEDVSALGTSLRVPAHDARLPTGFQRVYRVPGQDGMLMRGNGALFAVFPESVYRRSPRGATPIAPPGTVFHIGMPGDVHHAPPPPAARALAPGQVDGRVSTRVGPDAPAGAARIGAPIDGRHATPSDAASGASPGDRTRTDTDASDAAPAVRVSPIAPATQPAAAGIYAHLGFGPPRVERR